MLKSIQNWFSHKSDGCEQYFKMDCWWSEYVCPWMGCFITFFYWFYIFLTSNWFSITIHVIPFAGYIVYSEVLLRSLHNKKVELYRKLEEIKREVKDKRRIICKTDKECNTSTSVSRYTKSYLRNYKSIVKNPWSNTFFKFKTKKELKKVCSETSDSSLLLASDVSSEHILQPKKCENTIESDSLRDIILVDFVKEELNKMLWKNEIRSKIGDFYNFFGPDISRSFFADRHKDENGNNLREISQLDLFTQYVKTLTLNEKQNSRDWDNKIKKENSQYLLTTKNININKKGTELKNKANLKKIINAKIQSVNQKKDYLGAEVGFFKRRYSSSRENTNESEKLKEEKKTRLSKMIARIKKHKLAHEAKVVEILQNEAKKEMMKLEKQKKEREQRSAEIAKLREKNKKLLFKANNMVNSKNVVNKPSKEQEQKNKVKKKLNKVKKDFVILSKHNKCAKKNFQNICVEKTRAKSDPQLVKGVLKPKAGNISSEETLPKSPFFKEEEKTEKKCEEKSEKVDIVKEIINSLIEKNIFIDVASTDKTPIEKPHQTPNVRKFDKNVSNSKSRAKLTIKPSRVPRLSFKKKMVTSSNPVTPQNNNTLIINNTESLVETIKLPIQKKNKTTQEGVMGTNQKKDFPVPKLNNATRLRCQHIMNLFSLPSSPKATTPVTESKSQSAPTSPRKFNCATTVSSN